MTDTNRCPRCGAERPADAPGDLCPRCLLQFGIGLGLSAAESSPVERDVAMQAVEPCEGHADTDTDTDAEANTDAGLAIVDRTDLDEGQGEAARLPKGTRVRYFGDYELQRELGRGGMGVVYKARQVSLNRPVALKMIRAGRAGRRRRAAAVPERGRGGRHARPPAHRADLRGRRARRPALLQHEAGRGRQPGRAARRLRRRPARRAARLVAEAAEAVHHAHQRGILHRDLKPANILVDDRGPAARHRLRPGQAGRGRRRADASPARSWARPPTWRPSRPSGRRGAVTTATDVYGLGAILYALLTGRPPFGGDTVAGDARAGAGRGRPSRRAAQPAGAARPGDDLPEVPGEGPAAAVRLGRGAGRRPGAWLAGEPIAARPVGAAERAWMWCRRNPGLAGALAAAVAAGAGRRRRVSPWPSRGSRSTSASSTRVPVNGARRPETIDSPGPEVRPGRPAPQDGAGPVEPPPRHAPLRARPGRLRARTDRPGLAAGSSRAGARPSRRDDPAWQHTGSRKPLRPGGTSIPSSRPSCRMPDEPHGGLQPRRQDRPHRRASTGRRGSGTPPPASPSARPCSIKAAVRAVAFSPDGKTVLTGEL